MSTYETAASTVLLASSCACCGRALRDAVSVEAGVGPDCREKYGYAEAQGAADWTAALAALGAVSALWAGSAVLAAVASVNPDMGAHKAANVLVHAAACAPRSERSPLIAAIAALGFTTLAIAVARAAGEVVEVRIESNAPRFGSRFVVVTPYEPTFNEAIKAARVGARFDRTVETGKRKPGAWTVPCDAEAKRALFGVLKTVFAGALLVSAKGVTRLAA